MWRFMDKDALVRIGLDIGAWIAGSILIGIEYGWMTGLGVFLLTFYVKPYLT